MKRQGEPRREPGLSHRKVGPGRIRVRCVCVGCPEVCKLQRSVNDGNVAALRVRLVEIYGVTTVSVKF